jgi:hypothetical protein
MGFATHLGPWLLGTVKNTTGTTPGTVRNTGDTIVAQTFKRDYTGVTTAGTSDVIACVPAGSQIIWIHNDTLTAFTGSTAANLTIGDGTTANKYWTTTDITTAGRASSANAQLGAWAGTATTAAPAGQGIGATDVLVTATLAPTVATVTAGTVQYTVVYTVRNSDGAQAPSASQN